MDYILLSYSRTSQSVHISFDDDLLIRLPFAFDQGSKRYKGRETVHTKLSILSRAPPSESPRDLNLLLQQIMRVE